MVIKLQKRVSPKVDLQTSRTLPKILFFIQRPFEFPELIKLWGFLIIHILVHLIVSSHFIYGSQYNHHCFYFFWYFSFIWLIDCVTEFFVLLCFIFCVCVHFPSPDIVLQCNYDYYPGQSQNVFALGTLIQKYFLQSIFIGFVFQTKEMVSILYSCIVHRSVRRPAHHCIQVPHVLCNTC